MNKINYSIANELMTYIKDVAKKVVTNETKSCVRSKVATIISVTPNNRKATVRFPESPTDGSQDLILLNKTGEVLSVGDEVYIEYRGNTLGNAEIRVRKNDAVPLIESDPSALADNKSIQSNGSDLLQVYNFDSADTGQIPQKSASNTIQWVDPITRYYETIVGDSSTTQFQIHHNKGTKNVIVQVRDSNEEVVYVKVQMTDINYCTVIFPKSQSGRTYTVVVL